MPDIFTLMAAVRDHGILFASTTLLVMVLGWLLYRDLRRYFGEHKLRLGKIDIMEDAIKGHKHGTRDRVYTREEIVEFIGVLDHKFDMFLEELGKRCYMENCPHHRSMETFMANIRDENKLIRDEIEGAVKDVKDVTHELLDFTGTLVQHFAGKGQNRE